MIEVLLGSVVFVCIVLLLATVVLAARAFLMPAKNVTIQVNGRQEITAKTGNKLLTILSDGGMVIPSACGGAGTCGQCRVQVMEGRTPALQTETALLSRQDIAKGVRLACQTTLRDNISITLPESMLRAKSWVCQVVSSRSVATLIREIVLDLPTGTDFTFIPGAFVTVEAPAYTLRFSDYAVSPEHQAAWDKMGVNDLTASSQENTSRAYSIATAAGEKAGRIVLLVRLALPPPNHADLPPGIVSSWLFGCAEGDKVNVSGPFSTFAAQDSKREMVFIGGGVGMAPLRAIISDQLEQQGATRKISFWYGARSRMDLFYEQEFEFLQEKHTHFHWTAALSDPAPDDDWQGETGFIHEVALRCHLAAHPAPHDCEYYLCGPPLMIRAVLTMLDDLGVDPERIFNDDFGG
ncbi:NADH:ubiquinone reductase (Na(+)-transporting) subunit F [Falsihalocynthiibacter sp. S25ZX9]|uniref:NADH:ubiquinone reductase (Na(+)-transporting) subunit F n=1 Tax=Falsihalocynthiibacter sp. S25ZX9 TaxID=3240870 RepID=UPI00350FF921